MSGNKEDIESVKTVSEEKDVIHPHLWKLLLVVGVFIYSSYTIFVHLCEVDGKMPFESSAMVLLIEITKLIMSAIMFIPEARETGGIHLPNFWNIIPFAVPGFLYCLNNNLAVFIQLEMDPSTYQVLGNFKILSTAILFRMIIKKPITSIQWGALGLLLVAGITNSYGGLKQKSTQSAGVTHITVVGILMISVYCTVSGLSGVYTEYVLKKQKEVSIHLQNGLLYTFGIFFNGSLFFIQSYNRNSFSLLKGFTIWTWLIVITQAIGGIIMGVIMKHASNITRLFLISTAMVVTTVLSIFIFGLHPNVYILLSMTMVTGALYIYHH